MNNCKPTFAPRCITKLCFPTNLLIFLLLFPHLILKFMLLCKYALGPFEKKIRTNGGKKI